MRSLQRTLQPWSPFSNSESLPQRTLLSCWSSCCCPSVREHSQLRSGRPSTPSPSRESCQPMTRRLCSCVLSCSVSMSWFLVSWDVCSGIRTLTKRSFASYNTAMTQEHNDGGPSSGALTTNRNPDGDFGRKGQQGAQNKVIPPPVAAPTPSAQSETPSTPSSARD